MEPAEPVEPDIIYPPGKNLAVLRNGVTVPTGPRGLSPSEIVGQLKDVVARRYTGDNPALQGMTLLEAAMLSAAMKAADGDLDALNKIWDRLLGKPLQQTIQATGTLQEFLNQIAQADTDPLGD